MLGHYLIKPTQALLDFLQQHSAVNHGLAKTTIWEDVGGLDRNLETLEQKLWRHKAIFMIYVLHLYNTAHKSDDERWAEAQFFEKLLNKPVEQILQEWQHRTEVVMQLLGAPPYKITDFDRWWTIEPVESWMMYANAIDNITQSDMDLFAPIGMAWLDEWLGRIREIKGRRFFEIAINADGEEIKFNHYVITPKQQLLDFLKQHPPVTELQHTKLWIATGDIERKLSSLEEILWMKKAIFMIHLLQTHDNANEPIQQKHKQSKEEYDSMIETLLPFTDAQLAEQLAKQKQRDGIVMQLLGAPPYKISDFDHWWTIEPHYTEGGFGYNRVLEKARESHMELFTVGELKHIDDWIQVLREFNNIESSY